MEPFLYPGMVVQTRGSKKCGVIIRICGLLIDVQYSDSISVWGGNFNLCLTPEQTAEEWTE